MENSSGPRTRLCGTPWAISLHCVRSSFQEDKLLPNSQIVNNTMQNSSNNSIYFEFGNKNVRNHMNALLRSHRLVTTDQFEYGRSETCPSKAMLRTNRQIILLKQIPEQYRGSIEGSKKTRSESPFLKVCLKYVQEMLPVSWTMYVRIDTCWYNIKIHTG